MGIFIEDRLIRTLRTTGTYYAIWPLSSEDGKLKRIICNILWCLYVINIPPQNYLAVKSMLHQKSLVDVSKSLVETAYMFEIGFVIIYCWIWRKQLQRLLFELEHPDKIWTPVEQIIRGKFMRRLHKICLPLVIISFGDTQLYMLIPVIIDRPIPLNFVYPFPISSFWIYCLVYVHSTFSLQQTILVVLFDVLIAVIMWHAAFKFYLLSMQINYADTAGKLRASIIEYHNIISYVTEIERISSIIIFKSVIVTFINTIAASLLILNNAPVVEICEYCMVALILIGRLFVCCWAAEEMTDKAYDTTWRIYNSRWMFASTKTRQTVCMVIQRCQKPVVIKAGGFVPIVSIRFCGNILYKTFTFFMALRAVL